MECKLQQRKPPLFGLYRVPIKINRHYHNLRSSVEGKMKIFFQAFFRDVSTTSAPLTSLKQNLFFTPQRKLCIQNATAFDNT
jgi:hypothetical protein